MIHFKEYYLCNAKDSNCESFLLRMSLSVASFVLSKFEPSNSFFSTLFSFSRYAALRAIWFSFSLLASRDLLAATLFLSLLSQYLSSLLKSGTNTFCLFLIIGCGLSSSMSKALSFGSKSIPGTVAKARSSGAKSKSTSSFLRLSS